MEHHRRILTDPAIVAIEIGLGIEQEIGDVHRDHQKQFALTAIHGAVGATQQQHQRRQDIEQRREEDAEVSHISGGEP
ncbi:hypothetical protein D3C77_401240 [compost metagenome]